MSKGFSCPPGQNILIRTMSSADRAVIEPYLKPVEMPRRMVLDEPNKPVKNVYFPTSGVGSTVAFSESGRRMEVGLFGHEGMSGTAIVMQAGQSSNETFMQVPGQGLVIEADRLRDALDEHPSLLRHLLRFLQTLMTQTTRTALSNGLSKLEQRLARWILMCHDRTIGDELELTHEFLSVMLGVRRAGVTVGTHMLEGKGLIRATRGCIKVLDRDGLEHEAQDAYGLPEAEYARLIGFDAPDQPGNAH